MVELLHFLQFTLTWLLPGVVSCAVTMKLTGRWRHGYHQGGMLAAACEVDRLGGTFRDRGLIDAARVCQFAEAAVLMSWMKGASEREKRRLLACAPAELRALLEDWDREVERAHAAAR